MKLFFALILGFSVITPAAMAQVELVSGDYFPAEFEFSEIDRLVSEETVDNPEQLSKIKDGKLFSDVGFQKYQKRTYAVGRSGSLSVEVVTLLDFRAAYSVLTLLRTGMLQEGPPGDVFTTADSEIRFAQGKTWVRIQGRDIPEDLARRVAVSVSNRIGSHRPDPPSLISHMPKTGLDASTLRYYPGRTPFESHAGTIRDYLKFDSDFEIAQARYSVDDRSGTLSLLSFPTREVAQDYFDGLAGPGPMYAKMAGPIVGVLEGPFDPATADRLLNDIQFSYSIRWIEDKPKVLWGIPAGILSTVVESLFFVVVLGAVSILAGAGFAAVRVALRKYAPKHSPDNPERTEITRLKLK